MIANVLLFSISSLKSLTLFPLISPTRSEANRMILLSLSCFMHIYAYIERFYQVFSRLSNTPAEGQKKGDISDSFIFDVPLNS